MSYTAQYADLADAPATVRTDVDPLDPFSDEEADRHARAELDSRESQAKRARRLIDGLHCRLMDDEFAIPTDDETAAIQSCRGTDFTVYSPQAFADEKFCISYLVDQVLVENQPAVIAGPPKALKTSVSIDLAYSLATGSKFLDTYDVQQPKRVLFLSAESGMGVIQSMARRICTVRQAELSRIPIHWGPWVPQVKSDIDLAVFRREIQRTRAEVVFLDPVYLAIDGTDAANVSLMGHQLKNLCDQILHFGATPVLVHHTTKTSPRVLERQPLELPDLAGAGVTEFFRQWILLNRREAFTPEQPHRLWLSAGGSAGHASQAALDIDEHRNGEGQCHGWSVTLQHGDDARQKAARDAAERKARAKADTAERVHKRHVEDVKKAFHGNGNKGLTKNDIRDLAGINGTDAGKAIGQLLREGWLEVCQVEKSGRKYDGYSHTRSESDKSDKQTDLSGLSQ